jgi:hypothetical protein
MDPQFPVLWAAAGLLLCAPFYLAALCIYRLFLHPLAKYPGPKLAALSNWYEFYYDVVQQGRFTFHIQELHKIYGMEPPLSWSRRPIEPHARCHIA